MTTSKETPAAKPARVDTDSWARPVDRLDASAVTSGARHDAVTGRRTAGPMQGFGQLWQKILEVPLTGSSATPQEVIAVWKERFTTFWPEDANFYAPLAGIQPGEVALLEIKPAPGPIRLSTGVVCIFADDESFAFMTPEGHALAAWITFSAVSRDGVTYARVEALERPADPLVELSYLLGGNRLNDRFWERTLGNIAEHFGAPDAVVERRVTCVDRRRQWRYIRNVRHSAVLTSFADTMAHPRSWFRRG
jgi:hypothetical protein